jgi:hypothetical protein
MELTNDELQIKRTNGIDRWIRAIKPFMNNYKLSYINKHGNLVIESDISTSYKGRKISNGINIYGNRYISIPMNIIETNSNIYNILSNNVNILSTYTNRNIEPSNRQSFLTYNQPIPTKQSITEWIPKQSDLTYLMIDIQMSDYLWFISILKFEKTIGMSFNESKKLLDIVRYRLEKTKMYKQYEIDMELGEDVDNMMVYSRLRNIKKVISILYEVTLKEQKLNKLLNN